MNCTFTVRYEDDEEKRTMRKPTLPKMVLSELKNGTQHGARRSERRHRGVKINNKPAGSLEGGMKPSETEG